MMNKLKIFNYVTGTFYQKRGEFRFFYQKTRQESDNRIFIHEFRILNFNIQIPFPLMFDHVMTIL